MSRASTEGQPVDPRLVAWAREAVARAPEDDPSARGRVVLAAAAIALRGPRRTGPEVPDEVATLCQGLTGPVLGALYEALLGGDPRAAADRRRRGSYFTPPWIVGALLDRALEPFLRGASSPGDVLRLRIVDPTVGAGAFLIGALARMARRCEELGGPSDAWRAQISARCLFGVDIDPCAAAVARAAIGLESGGIGPSRLASHLVHADVLSDPLPGPSRFHVVVGNPPWEKAKLLAAEYFAGRNRAVATAPNSSQRGMLIASLAGSDPAAAQAFAQSQAAAAERMRWYRESGRYPLTGTGDVNLYALVVERVLGLLAPDGLAGLVVPSGIATDHGTRRLFSHLLGTGQLHELLDFENRVGAFAGVHREERFCLLTLGGANRTRATFRCAFGLQPSGDASPEAVEVGPSALALLSPNTGNLPLLRSSTSLSVLEAIHRAAPPLVSGDARGGGSWGLRYSRMFDMSRDSRLFRSEPGEGLVPLYEGKMVHLYDHRHASVRGSSERRQSRSAAEVSAECRKRDPAFVPDPRYWVPGAEAQRRAPSAAWRIAFRDIANPNNERTFIVAALPGGVACGNTLPVLHSELSEGPLLACLLANLASVVTDYVVRSKAASRHANWYLVKQLPVIPPQRFSDAVLQRHIVDRVLALSYTSHSMTPMATGLGAARDLRPLAYDPSERLALRCQLDALFMALYGLEADAIDHILGSFEVLRRREEREHGEYLTRRLILEGMDAARAIAGG